MIDENMLPAYLRDCDYKPSHYYGTLSYNRRSGAWTIKGDNCVTEMAKRLFPGCDGRGRGVARFTAHRRIIGDLCWLMQRFPLEIKEADKARWEKALDDARDYAIRKEQAALMPQKMNPPANLFAGELRPFQQEGLAYLMQSRRALLADEMGLGKTVQALAFLASSGEYPAVIVPPPHLVRNWVREIGRFLGDDIRVHIIKGLTPYPLPEADVYIIHYLLLRGWKDVLPQCGFRTVIFDEIQELRRTGTGKYSAASLLSDKCDNVIGLSGTPIYNTGGEIWNVVNILDFHFLGDWESFTREWCYGYNTNIVQKPDQLGEYLRREGIMLRRRKADVLSELPPKRRLVQEIDWDDSVYREMMATAKDLFAQLQAATDESMRRILEEQVCLRERQATGLAKAPYVAAFVKTLIEGGEKVLLFAHHHAVMDLYKKELKEYHPVFITGRETDAQKDAAASKFMMGTTDICVISLRSASGLNLQRATTVVFGELDWSPAVHSQAEDRAHRMGQEDSIACYYLVSPKGSDRDMQDALGLKVSQFTSMMGDTEKEDRFLQESNLRRRVHELVGRLSGEIPE